MPTNPFTTKFPNLGLVEIDIDRTFVMADIPGLIEGAHKGVGLGHDFLKHIERAGIIVHLVEPAPIDGSDPVDNYRAIQHELTEYQHGLETRPQILVVSKCELPESADVAHELEQLTGQEVLRISAATGAGLTSLVHRIADLLAEPANSPDSASE